VRPSQYTYSPTSLNPPEFFLNKGSCTSCTLPEGLATRILKSPSLSTSIDQKRKVSWAAPAGTPSVSIRLSQQRREEGGSWPWSDARGAAVRAPPPRTPSRTPGSAPCRGPGVLYGLRHLRAVAGAVQIVAEPFA